MCLNIPFKRLRLINLLFHSSSQHSRPAIPRVSAGRASPVLLLLLLGLIIVKWPNFVSFSTCSVVVNWNCGELCPLKCWNDGLYGLPIEVTGARESKHWRVLFHFFQGAVISGGIWCVCYRFIWRVNDCELLYGPFWVRLLKLPFQQ